MASSPSQERTGPRCVAPSLRTPRCGASAPRAQISREERRILAEPLRVPVLSLVGRDDGAWSTLDHAADAQFVDAPLTQIVIREAGHFLPEEAPQAVADALSEHALAHAK